MLVRFLRHYSQEIVRFWRQKIYPRVSPIVPLIWLVGFAIAAFALWGFAEIAEEILDQETEIIDTLILKGIYSLHTPFLTGIMLGITFLGDPVTLVILSIVFGIISIAQRQWEEVITLAIAAAGANLLNLWLKELFARSRPQLWEPILDVSYSSFPSGHAMISLVVYGVLGYWLLCRFPRRHILITTATVVLILMIGFSRLYLGVHWPTDVVAGYAAGIVWLVVSLFSLEVMARYFSFSSYPKS